MNNKSIDAKQIEDFGNAQFSMYKTLSEAVILTQLFKIHRLMKMNSFLNCAIILLITKIHIMRVE